MATIGVLNLLYSADTTGLAAGTKAARAHVMSADEVAKESAENWKKFRLAVIGAGIGAAASLEEMTRSGFAAINATRQMAARVGTSVDELSRLQSAAKLAGVDSETLGTAFFRMERSLSEVAETGAGKAAPLLERLGLDAKALTSQDPAETFKEMVGALGGIANPMERMKAAMDLFGRGSQPILQLVMKGREGIEQMEESADRLGVSFNDIDAAKVQEAAVSLQEIWEAVEGVGRSLAIELAPWIHEVAERFVDWAKSGVNAGSMVTQAVDWVGNAMSYLADVVQVAQTAFYGFRAVFLEGLSFIVSGIDKVINAFGYLYEKVTGSKLELTNFFKDWSDQLEGSAVKDLDRAGQIWGKEWGHATVRAFADEVKLGAESRAVHAAEQAAKFRMPGEEIETRGKASTSVKAAELGSSEAANTILRTAFGGGRKDMAAVADHTKRTADGIAQLIDKVAAFTGMSELEVMEGFST